MKLLQTIHSAAARRASYTLLLVAMVLHVLVSPILLEAGMEQSWLVSALFLLVLLGCLASAVEEVKWFGLLILAVFVFEVLAGLVMREVNVPSIIIHHALRLLVLGATAFILLRALMRGARVTVDTVLGAICVYFLLGMLWAEAYVIIEHALPDSFRYPEHVFGTAWNPREYSLAGQYFSFVTITTLGYGDVVPVRAVARSVSMLQAVTGQFYIAIVVARLVSMYVMSHPRADGAPADRAD